MCFQLHSLPKKNAFLMSDFLENFMAVNIQSNCSLHAFGGSHSQADGSTSCAYDNLYLIPSE